MTGRSPYLNGVSRPTLSQVQEHAREARREAFRGAVFVAARELFERRGFRDVKMSDIAEAVGVAKGTLYNYFENKEEIFAELAEEYLHDLFAVLDAEVAARSGWGRLEALVEGVLAVVERNARGFAVYVEVTDLGESTLAHAGGRKAYLGRLRSVLEELHQAGELRASISLAIMTPALDGIIDAVIRHWHREDHPPGLAAKAPEIIELFARGVRRES